MALLALVGGAATLRFLTLDVQRLSNEEPFTVAIVSGVRDSVFSTVESTELTPPLDYYWSFAADEPACTARNRHSPATRILLPHRPQDRVQLGGRPASGAE